jgi:radical SAM/Cys-rich protein
MLLSENVMIPLEQYTLNDPLSDWLARDTGALSCVHIDTVQVNVGLRCDLACRHCHVESSPARTEEMDWETMKLVLSAAQHCGARTIDITGGAPEMNPHFLRLVRAARANGFAVIVRTNLTIMLHEGYTDLPAFYRDQPVELVASLPCYLPQNVDRQRGGHVHERSIEAIRRLNAMGYGIDPDLRLVLVYNPLGPVLPPPQATLERDYRHELYVRFGIEFTRLITITNMPIGRFLYDLRRDGDDERYMQLLRESFNAETVEGLMCRRQVHVGWDGTLHDCDFNHALKISTDHGAPRHIRDFDPAALAQRRVVTGPHCLGCTAGHGSSCGGALT